MLKNIINQKPQSTQENRTLPKDSQFCYVATEHLREWVEDSAVSTAIATLNIESISAEEANKRVKPKHPIKDDGWWCRGVNWRTGEYLSERHGQFKPNRPHHNPEKNSDSKYLAASRITPDAVFLKMPGDDDYWQNIYNSLSNPIFWTEGGKKAGAGLSIDLPTISLTGVWNWGKQGKLAPEVLNWVQRGGTQYLCFDSDYREKDGCREAIRRFCTLAREHGTEIRIVSWDSQWKGMDDFIKGNGKEAFLDAIKIAQTLEQWEKQFTKDDDKPSKGRPVPRLVAREIAEEFQQRFKYHNQQQLWRHWNDKYWEKYDDGSFLSAIKTILDSKNVNYKGHAFLNDVGKLLECDLRVRKWKTFDTSKYIAFNNGVLEVSTGKLLEHSPGFGFTSHLPYDYKPILIKDNILDTLKSECPSVYRFMVEAMKGDEQAIKKLLAVINGVIKFRFSELQYYVHVSGKPRTGKGTFLRLLQNCIGKDHFPRSAVDLISKTTGHIPVYETREQFLAGWEQLKPKSRYYVGVLIRATDKGEKFLKKTLPKLGITPAELGLSDPNPEPSEPKGDQISLFD
jgi:putative DNA primase/helicase